MRKASWILLTIVGTLTLLFSLLSASVAYYQPQRDVIEGKTFAPSTEKDEAGNTREALDLPEPLETALRARRGTAASYAAAFATLFLAIVLHPYRRGEVWAWWALLAGLLVLNAVTIVRVPAMGTSLGVPAAATLLAIGVVALLLDVKRLKRS